MKKRILAIFLILTMILISVAACSSRDQTDTNDNAQQEELPELTFVRLNQVTHSLFFTPLYVAIEQGYFEEEGIELDLVTGFGADRTMTALLAGEADIGFMGPEASIFAYNAGATDVVINFAQLTQRAGNFVVGREEISDFSWDDLRGTLVLGGRRGGMPQMVFEYILKENGIDPTEDLEINQSIDFGATAAAFLEGLGDFTIEFEPGATILESAGRGYVIASLGEASGYVPYTAFSAKQSFIDENPEVIQGFTNALQRAMEFVGSHTPEEIAEIIEPHFPEADLETITTIVARYHEQQTWNENLIFEEESFDLLQDILESAGELTRRAPYEHLVITNFAEEAIN